MTKKEMKKKLNAEKEFKKGIETYSESNEVKKVAFITLGLLVVFALVYFLTALATGEIKLGKTKYNAEESKISYDEIIVGDSLNRPYNEYYVLYVDYKKDEERLLVNDIKETNTKVYTVNMDNRLSSSYKAAEGEVTNVSSANVNEWKIAGPVLIKVVDHKVTETYIENSKIEEVLSKMK